jgi:hypothetical protein
MDLHLEGADPVGVVKTFEHGDFIKKRSITKYAIIARELEAHESLLADYSLWKNDTYKYWQLMNLYKGLLGFKLSTDFRYYGAVEGLEVGYAYAHSLKMDAIDKVVAGKMDQLLALLIDPEQSVLDVFKLKEQFEYPNGNYDSKYLDERIKEEF